ncbi:MAG: sensor histidine kinase [Octadecabacter sp.]
MIRCLLVVLLVMFSAVSAIAQSPTPTKPFGRGPGTVIEFTEGEFAFARGTQTPDIGWQADSNPHIDFQNVTGQARREYRAMSGRYFFTRDSLGPDTVAVYLVGVRGNFSVSMNGGEIFRNYASKTDQQNSWYRPFLIPIPSDTLMPGLNQLSIHSFTNKTTGIGRVMIGSNPVLQDHYRWQYFWHVAGPKASNFAMLLIGFLVFIFWLGRRHEIELLWLSVATVLWFMRNHQYYTATIPFNLELYTALTLYSTYFAIVASCAFYFCFIKLPHRNLIMGALLLLGVIATCLHRFVGFSSIILYIPTLLVIFGASIFGIRDLIYQRSIERRVLAIGLTILPLSGFYDVYMLIRYAGDGHTTYLAIFSGIIFSVAFLISFGKRVLDAFGDLEKSNLVLEKSIAETRAELAESEAIRQELLVSQTIASERNRLMQEMHDGIGSNLTTALAVARQQDQPETTVKVLSRALGDLKLTVDSLEPVEGDLVALIGNLRHRVARDLADAGITCKWEVEDCQPLTWLDAANALHVLRIHSEVISNVLTHSNATAMRIGCVESVQDGVTGISTYVADNGDGFDVDAETSGKGLANIKGRAHSLYGKLSYTSQPGEGTTVTLWLPYILMSDVSDY